MLESRVQMAIDSLRTVMLWIQGILPWLEWPNNVPFIAPLTGARELRNINSSMVRTPSSLTLPLFLRGV